MGANRIRSEKMGTIHFTGEGPFYLETLREPTTNAEDDVVVVILTVSALGLPGSTAEIRVNMAVPQAKQLASQLRRAIPKAEAYSI
jgi:hypothetical protein